MGSKQLKQAIDKHLFISLDDELITQLHEVSNSMVADLDAVSVSDYVCSFMQNNVSQSFTEAFRVKYKEMYGEEVKLPAIVSVILETYVILLALQSDETEEMKKMHFSLIVRNYAVLRKGDRNRLLCQNWIMEMYSYYETYAADMVKSSINYSQLLDAVVPSENWNDTGLDITQQAVYDQIRSLCMAGYYGRISGYIKTWAFKKLTSPFAQVYVLVCKMVKEWNWKYLSLSPVKKLVEVLGENCKRKKMLSNIVTEVLDEVQKEQLCAPDEESSVLLTRVYNNRPIAIDSRMFTALEFGVYIYYEMLLETFND